MCKLESPIRMDKRPASMGDHFTADTDERELDDSESDGTLPMLWTNFDDDDDDATTLISVTAPVSIRRASHSLTGSPAAREKVANCQGLVGSTAIPCTPKLCAYTVTGAVLLLDDELRKSHNCMWRNCPPTTRVVLLLLLLSAKIHPNDATPDK